jgi:hypothetical protein
MRLFKRNTAGVISFLTSAFVFTCACLSIHTTTLAAATDRASSPGVPVLIELFTSEGCSSCPPADDLLAQLDKQPIPGVHAIVLSEHVTYWDRLGWKDPFSMDAMTDRQRDYGSRFHLDDIYTPQAVVDGATQFTGSDARKMEAAIQQAVTTPKTELTILSAQWTGTALEFSAHASSAPDAILFAALAYNAEQVSVLKGENGGHTLHHVAVVRALQNFGKTSNASKSPMDKPLTLSMPKNEPSSATPLRLVVFLADRKNGHILGVAEQTISRSR